MPQENSPRASLHEKRDQRRVRLSRVADPARQNQIVGAVVGGLPSPRANMVQGDEIGRSLAATVGAHWAMTGKEPFAVGLHGATG
jgi:hypothetical protein